MKETATVINVNNDTATVRVIRGDACHGCRACSMWSEDNKFMDFDLKNTLLAKKGDTVLVDMAAPDFLRAALIMYAVPLFLMMAFAMAVYYYAFPGNQLYTALASIAGAAAGFILIKLFDGLIKKDAKFYPVMIDIVDDKDQDNLDLGSDFNLDADEFFSSTNYKGLL